MRPGAALPALLALSAAISCASGPAAATAAAPAASPAPAAELPAASAPGVPAGGEAPPAPAGTAIKTAEPAELSKGREERAAIEAAIVFGSPSSISRALELVAASAFLRPEEAGAYRGLAEGIAAIAYPEAPRPSGPAAGGGSGGTSSPGANVSPGGEPAPAEPAPGASPAPAPAPSPAPAASPEPAAKVPPPLAAALSLLAEARAGRAPQVPPEAAGTALGELMPALALFSSASREVARRANDALDRFARLGAPSVLPDLALGADAERQRSLPAALARYAAALSAAPDAWPAGLGSGRVLLALGRPEEALAALEPLAGKLGGSLAFDRPFASALVENGRYAEADPLVARVLTADPQDSALVLTRARLLARAKAYQQALPLLDAYGTVDPASRLYLLLRSRVSEGLKNRDDALRWARRGLSSYPDDPELLVVAARLLYAGGGGGREEARSLAARAATRPAEEPGSGPAERADRAAARSEAAGLLAEDAASRGEWSAAADYLASAAAASPFADRALAARILRKAGRYPAALDYAADWYRAEPSSEPAAEALLRALIESGDAKAAQELIARILPGTHTSAFRSSLFYLQSRLQKGDDAALPLLRSALMENADNPEALAALSDIQLRRKDYAKARFYLKQALALSPEDPELIRRQVELDKASP